MNSMFKNIVCYENVINDLAKLYDIKNNQLVGVTKDRLFSWDIPSGKVLSQLPKESIINDVHNLSNSSAFVCASNSGLLVYSHDLQNKIQLKSQESWNLSFISVSANHSEQIVCASTETVPKIFRENNVNLMAFWDIRQPSKPLGFYRESHSKEIVSLSFKYGSDYELLSGSLDGLMVVYDTREESEDESIRQVLNTEEDVCRADWLTLNNGVFCLTAGSHQLWMPSSSGSSDELDRVLSLLPLQKDAHFIQDVAERGPNQLFTLSLSKDSRRLCLDDCAGSSVISATQDELVSAFFLSDDRSVVAFSDNNIFVCS